MLLCCSFWWINFNWPFNLHRRVRRSVLEFTCLFYGWCFMWTYLIGFFVSLENFYPYFPVRIFAVSAIETVKVLTWELCCWEEMLTTCSESANSSSITLSVEVDGREWRQWSKEKENNSLLLYFWNFSETSAQNCENILLSPSLFLHAQ